MSFKMPRHGSIFVALFLFLAAATARRPPRMEPLPVCDECVPREDILAPGIGFDLADSYGTAAIRSNDGTIVKLGKVNADQDYTNLIERLSDPSTKLSCHSTTWEEIYCSYLQARRRLNKLRGLPATKDVGIIANLISQLRKVVDSQLGAGTTKKVLPTLPTLPGLQQDDLRDAMEYSGISLLVTHKHLGGYAGETSSAYAGMGHGLCEHYEKCESCEVEEANMPYSHLLALSLTQHSFSVAYTYMQSAFSSLHEAEIVRFDLGLAHEVDEKERYWEQIRESIVTVGRAAMRPLDDVLLLGEEGDNPRFLEIMREALLELDFSAPRVDLDSMEGMMMRAERDPLYIAARGAAEFAKRTQASPPNCREPPRCAGNRDPQNVFQDEL